MRSTACLHRGGALPDLTVVRAASAPVDGVVTPPGSKSITIRALTAAGLAEGRSHLYGALSAADPEAMMRVLAGFRVLVDAEGDPWVVDGTGGRLTAPDEVLDVGESGLTARIALVLAALAEGDTTIDGHGRLRQRPMWPLLDVLRSHDVGVSSRDGHLPVKITGDGGRWGGSITVDAALSSQFATALMMAAPLSREPTSLRVDRVEGSGGYMDVTVEVMRAFGAQVTPNITGFEIAPGGYRAADLVVEPDASAAVYPMVAAALTGGRIEISGLGLGSNQPDVVVATRLAEMGCTVEDTGTGLVVEATGVDLAGIDVDMSPAPDGALALAVACLFASGPSRIRGLGSLRHKESDRLAALSEEMGRIGAAVEVDGDSLLIEPAALQPAVIDPHNDHRIAMAMALVGLRVEGLEVAEPGVVAKTWPDYWETLEEITPA